MPSFAPSTRRHAGHLMRGGKPRHTFCRDGRLKALADGANLFKPAVRLGRELPDVKGSVVH